MALKVLILKPSSLGDVVQALPVLRLIRRHRPGWEVYWWIETRWQGLLEDDPDLAGLIPFDRRRWGSPSHWGEALASLRAIRAARFDLVLDLQSLLRSAVLGWCCEGALKIGLNDPREGAPVFHDVSLDRPSPNAHAVDWYLEVVRYLGLPAALDFEWLPPRPAAAERWRSVWGDPRGPFVVLVPGARWETKRWPTGAFSRLAGLIASARPHATLVVVGGRDDMAMGAEIANAAPGRVLDLCGKTGLDQMVEWVRRAALVVTNDTGPMHVAAALSVPTVALFGPTDPRRTGPYGSSGRVLQQRLDCVPCLKPECARAHRMECLDTLGVDRVWAEVEAAFPK